MRFLQVLIMKLRAAFRRPQVEQEMEAELAAHLEQETESLIATGIPPERARRQALKSMGRLDLIKEECRDSRGTAGWEQLKQDVAYGFRLLTNNRTFSFMVLVTIALGIGSTTAVFSLISGLLLRPLPFADPERLFHASAIGMRGPFDTLQANSKLADYAAHLGIRSFTVLGNDTPERLKGSEVSANFFNVLGVSPVVGSTFQKGQNQPGRTRSAVLSFQLWKQKFDGSKNAIGQKIVLNEIPHEIVGVMPANFQYPSAECQLWVPMRLDPRIVGEFWGAGGLSVFARLRPGAGHLEAEAELRAWVPRIRAMFPWRMPDAWATDAGLPALQEQMVADVKVRSLLLLGVVILVLLIAVVNVANLLVGQAEQRRPEFAMRESLGATPGRLARQLLTEAVLFALTGGVLGMLLSFGQLAVLKKLLPADTPRLSEISIDGSILAFSAVVSVCCGILFGLWPAWQLLRHRSRIGVETNRSTLNRIGVRTHASLVMIEAAFATILVAGSGLLLHSLWELLQVEPGFRIDSLVTAELSPNRGAVTSAEKSLALLERVQTAMSAYPGVSNVAAANIVPLSTEISAFTAAIEDHPRPPQEPQFTLWSTTATPQYLETLGIRLLQGRGFESMDGANSEKVVLVSNSTARRYWPDKSPIGRRLKPVWETEWRTIVGVVDDVKQFSLSGPPEWVKGEVYLPMTQAVPLPSNYSILTRLTGDTSSFERQLPKLIQSVCGTCAVSKIAKMDAVVADAAKVPRSIAWLVAGFAMLALGMASAGIYGVVNQGVQRRGRELSIRIALGASRGHVAWQVMASSLLFTLIGTTAGLAVAWQLSKLVKSLLFGIAGQDPLTFAVTPVVMVLVSILASLIPLYRAMTIDPARSLREG